MSICTAWIWDNLTAHYRKFLPHINNNYDFSEMLSELLGELNVSHTGSGYRAPGSEDKTANLGLFVSSDNNLKGLKIDENTHQWSLRYLSLESQTG